jgi:hypothetical protein
MADMFSAVFSILAFVLDVVPYHWGCTVSQYTVWGGFLLSTGMSIFVQAHFTAGLLMTLRRWRRGLVVLGRVLPMLIIPAMLTTVLDLWMTSRVFFMDGNHGCVWKTRPDATAASGPFTAGVALFVIIVNSLFYALLLQEETVCGSLCVPSVVIPGSIGTRVLRQARRYMLVTVCTWLPYWLVKMCGRTPTLTWASSGWEAASAMGITLNGAMNVWSFALHNRHIKRAVLRDTVGASSESDTHRREDLDALGMTHTGSRHVGFDCNLQIQELTEGSQSQSAASFPAKSDGDGSSSSRHVSAGADLLNEGGEDPLGFFFRDRSSRRSSL